MKNITYEIPKTIKRYSSIRQLDRIPDLILEIGVKYRVINLKLTVSLFQAPDKTRMEVLRQAVCYTNGIKSLLRKDKSVPCLYVRNSTHKIESWQGDSR